ncbi:MAG: DNA-deoxyinosine glycosylase, partial [Firmicutes bacterium]|nr:DNA-deoxyinosine glycosylase [Bacillota bacterium]
MAETRILSHPFPPVYDEHSEILILGSFPSVKSVEDGYYYANPLNRFYPMMSELFHEDFVKVPWADKRKLLLKHHVALHDAIGKIAIEGSSDAKIHHAEPADLKLIFEKAKIHHIYCNGAKAYEQFLRYFPEVKIPVTVLPSTSPANARMR